jgi:hypothetical protein
VKLDFLQVFERFVVNIVVPGKNIQHVGKWKTVKTNRVHNIQLENKTY